MLIATILFLIGILITLTVVSYSANEVKMGARQVNTTNAPSELSFRKIEKVVLYYGKYIIQGLIITTVKYSFIAKTKTQKFLMDKWPKVHKVIILTTKKPILKTGSFISHTIKESKIKIKHIKERVKRDHDM